MGLHDGLMFRRSFMSKYLEEAIDIMVRHGLYGH